MATPTPQGQPPEAEALPELPSTAPAGSQRPVSRPSAGFADAATALPFGNRIASLSMADSMLPPLAPGSGHASTAGTQAKSQAGSYHHRIAAQRSAADAAKAVKQARVQLAIDASMRRFPITYKHARMAFRATGDLNSSERWQHHDVEGSEILLLEDTAEAPLALPPAPTDDAYDAAAQYLPLAPRTGASEFGAVAPPRATVPTSTTSIGVQAAPVGWTRYFFNDQDISRAVAPLGLGAHASSAKHSEESTPAGPWLYMHFDVRMTPRDELMWLVVAPVEIEGVEDPSRPVVSDALGELPSWVQTLYDQLHFASLECHLGQRVTAGGWPDAPPETRSKAVWDHNIKRGGKGLPPDLVGFNGSKAARMNLESVVNYASVIDPRGREDAIALVRLQSGLLQVLLNGVDRADENCIKARKEVEAALANLTREHDDLQGKASELEATLVDARDKLAKAAAEKQEALRSKMGELSDKFTREREALEEEMEGLRGQIKELGIEKAGLEGRIEALEKELADVIASKEKIQAKKEAMKEEMALLHTAMSEAEERSRDLRSTIQSLELKKDEAEERTREAESKLEGKTMEMMSLASDASKLAAALDTERETVDRISTELHEMKTMQRETAAITNAKIQELMAKNNKMTKELEDTKGEAKELKNQVVESEKNDKYLASRVKEDAEKLEEARKRESDVLSKWHVAQREKEQVLVQKKALNGDVKDLKQRNAELLAKAKQEEVRRDGLKKEIERLKETINGLQGWASNDKKLVAQVEVLTEENERMSTEIAVLSAQKSDLKVSNAVAGVRIVNYRSDLAELRAQLEELSQVKERSQEAASVNEKRKLQMTMEIAKLRKDVERLQDINAATSKQAELDSNWKQTQEAESRKLKQDLLRKSNECAALNQGIDGLKVLEEQLEKMSKDMSTMKMHFDQCKVDLASTTEELEYTRQVKGDIEDHVRELKLTIRRKDAEISAYESGKDPDQVLVKQLEQLQHEKKMLESRLESEQQQHEVEELIHSAAVEEQKDDEIEALMSNMEMCRKEIAQLRGGKDVNTVLEEQLKESEAARIALKQETEKSAAHAGALEGIKEALGSEIEELKESVSARDELLHMRDQTIKQLREQLQSGAEGAGAPADMSEMLDKLQAELAEAHQKLKAAGRESERLAHVAEEAKSDATGAKERLAAVEGGQTADAYLEKRLETVLAELNKKNAVVKSLKAVMANMDAQQESAERMRREAEGSLDSVEAKLAEAQRAAEHAAGDQSKWQVAVTTAAEEKARHQSLISALQAQVGSLREGKTVDDFLETRNGVLESELAECKAHIAAAQGKDREQASRLSEALEEAKNATLAETEVRRVLKAREAHLAELRRLNEEQAAKLAQAEAKLETAEAVAKAAPDGKSIDEALIARNQVLEAELVGARVAVEEERRLRGGFVMELDLATKEISALRSRLGEAKETESSAMGSVHELEKTLDACEADKAWAHNECIRLAKHAARLELRLQATAEVLKALEGGGDAQKMLDSAIHAFAEEHGAAIAQSKVLESSKTMERVRAEQLANKAASSDAAAARSEREMGSRDAEIERLQARLKALAEDKAALAGEVEGLRAESRALRDGATLDEHFVERNQALEKEASHMRLSVDKLAGLKDAAEAKLAESRAQEESAHARSAEAEERARSLERQLEEAEDRATKAEGAKARADQQLDAARQEAAALGDGKTPDEFLASRNQELEKLMEDAKVQHAMAVAEGERLAAEVSTAVAEKVAALSAAKSAEHAANAMLSNFINRADLRRRWLPPDHAVVSRSVQTETDEASKLIHGAPRPAKTMEGAGTEIELDFKAREVMADLTKWWEDSMPESVKKACQLWVHAAEPRHLAATQSMNTHTSTSSELFARRGDPSGQLASLVAVPNARKGDFIVGGEGTVRLANARASHGGAAAGAVGVDAALAHPKEGPAVMRAYTTGEISVGVSPDGSPMVAIPIVAPAGSPGEPNAVLGVMTTGVEVPEREASADQIDEAIRDSRWRTWVTAVAEMANLYGKQHVRISEDSMARFEAELNPDNPDMQIPDIDAVLAEESAKETEVLQGLPEDTREAVLAEAEDMGLAEAAAAGAAAAPGGEAPEDDMGLAPEAAAAGAAAPGAGGAPAAKAKASAGAGAAAPGGDAPTAAKAKAKADDAKAKAKRARIFKNLSRVRAANMILCDLIVKRSKLTERIFKLLKLMEKNTKLNNALKEVRMYRNATPVVVRLLTGLMALLEPDEPNIFASLPVHPDAIMLDEAAGIKSLHTFPEHKHPIQALWKVIQGRLKKLGGKPARRLVDIALRVKCPSELAKDNPKRNVVARSFSTVEEIISSIDDAQLKRASSVLPSIKTFLAAEVQRQKLIESIDRLHGSEPAQTFVRSVTFYERHDPAHVEAHRLVSKIKTAKNLMKWSIDHEAKSKLAQEGLGDNGAVFKGAAPNATSKRKDRRGW